MFTSGQIKKLLKNENVAKCSTKSITYSKKFKLGAIKLYGQGLTSSEIFRQSGFDFSVISRDQPKECLRRWNNIFRKKGLEGLSEVRGQNSIKIKSKTKDLNDADKIKRLEIEIAYLKAENDFLAKLRAKRKE